MHTLKANIKATEEVTFEIAFTSLNNPPTNVKERIAEDSGKCIIKLPSTATDKRFWTMTADDAYYKCADYICAGGVYTISTETTKDWFTYQLDYDAYNPFCVPQTDSVLKETFACKEIKCAHRRLINTGDDVYDFQFTPTATVADKMKILKQHSYITINKTASDDYQVAGALGADVLIDIGLGATHLTAGLALAFSTFALF